MEYCSTTSLPRGETFVTRKITKGLVDIYLGKRPYIHLGNLNALRDWGHAKDFVEMQWLMLQQKQPEDFVIATGKQHSVKDIVEMAASELEMEQNGKARVLMRLGLVTVMK